MITKQFYWLMLYSYMIGFAACRSVGEKQPVYTLSIEQTKLLPALSSGSGLALHNNAAFVISDNTNGFYIVDAATYAQIFFPFVQGDSSIIQNKNIKEDFENATAISLNGAKHIIAFGSGSVENTRENILWAPVDSPQVHNAVSAKDFYSNIKNKTGINTSLLNIEGSFSTADSFYLLNRGSNHLIGMSLPDLKNLLNATVKKSPEISTKKFSLPLVDDFPIGFSGACYYKDNRFLFTATVEKTTNWKDDGEVAGSYIGMARTDGQLVFLLPLKNDKGIMVKEKLESIDIINEDTEGNILLYAIADNDDGKSTWFTLSLKRN